MWQGKWSKFKIENHVTDLDTICRGLGFTLQ